MVDRRLGRGLDFFLSGGRTPPAEPTRPVTKPAGDEVALAPIDSLVPSPFQARKQIAEAELKALADSIRESGILQPMLVRRVGDKLEIVAGERRWRAARLAGLEKVPVLERAITDQDASVFGLVENLQREDLNAIEKAQGLRALQKQLGGTQDEVARKVGFDRSTFANFVRLLDLPPEVQAHVSRGTLSMGHARALLSLSSPDLMVQQADAAIRKGLSVRALESEVRDLLEASKGAAKSPSKRERARPVWVNELEEALVDALGTPVHVRYGRKRSQIVIDCAGREEFERIFQRLKNS